MIGLLVLAGLWLLASLKSSRSDGTLLDVHPYRRLMFFIMRTRNESVVYFDAVIDADRLLAFSEKVRKSCDANLTHVVVAAANIALAATPRMNRFVVGRRLYARNGRWLTFAMKRKKLDRDAKLATIKLQMLDGESFAGFAERVNAQIGENRSEKRTSADKEYDLFNLLPRPFLWLAGEALFVLDYYNLLPAFFIRDDPMYTSIFLANLGSLDMDPGYHHLYEYGTCPLFIVVGRVVEEPTVEDGVLTMRRRLRVRFSYDERIEDGLNARFGIEGFVRVLSDPERWIGSTGEDDRFALWPRADWDDGGRYSVRN